MSLNLDFWKPIIGDSWFNNNQPLFNSSFMGELLAKVNQEYQKGVIYPLQKDIFKAFKLTPFDKVRVVIIGQDPYATGLEDSPHATGLAFAHDDESNDLPLALRNIHRAVETNCYNGLKVDFDFSLEEWASQGVLLLNTALTVNKHRSGSHVQYWDGFTRYVLESLNKQKTDLHFVFWGNHDKKYMPLINGMFHYKYESSDPSIVPKMGTNWDCTSFKDINTNIITKGDYDEIIAW